ncbi:unnamed protein product [Absidia cylindrospora]
MILCLASLDFTKRQTTGVGYLYCGWHFSIYCGLSLPWVMDETFWDGYYHSFREYTMVVDGSQQHTHHASSSVTHPHNENRWWKPSIQHQGATATSTLE